MKFLGNLLALTGSALLLATNVHSQMIDNTQATNTAAAGINKSLTDEVGPGRGNIRIPGSSMYLIKRDPYRAVRRGRQLFQRKFTVAQGLGPTENDGIGDINTDLAIGAGVSDSCAGCHSHPRGSAGAGGNVVTRPDSRDAPHLFGLGLKEMLADELTAELRDRRSRAIAEARTSGVAVTRPMTAKGIQYGTITARPDGTVDTSKVEGVD